MSRFLITGGSQGIGAAIVAHARKAGHDVVFTGRRQAAIEAVAKKEGAHGITADVAIDADNARVVEFCMSKMGGVDVLINNAGVGYIADVGAIDMDKMRGLFGINVFGMVDMANRVVPGMIKQGSGDIINIASTSGTKGAKGYTAYAGSKWAVRGISQCWQAELRPHGIRVMCLLPSEVQTNWMGRAGRNNPNKLYAHDIAATIFAALEMPRNVLWP
jgi:3-oxoacyl-[acyl-carrier protein] reductase